MTPPATPNPLLRAWREDHHLNRPQMANAINATPTAQQQPMWCTPTHIWRWETGRIRWPSPIYQAALHDLTGHTPTALGFTPPTRRPQPKPSTRTDIRQATKSLLTYGIKLDITNGDDELIITNPDRPDRGHAAISLNDGRVSWTPRCPPHPGCRGPRDWYGHLDGITTDHDDQHTTTDALPVPALMILHLLTGST